MRITCGWKGVTSILQPIICPFTPIPRERKNPEFILLAPNHIHTQNVKLQQEPVLIDAFISTFIKRLGNAHFCGGTGTRDLPRSLSIHHVITR